MKLIHFFIINLKPKVKIYIGLSFLIVILHFLLSKTIILNRSYSIFNLDEEVTIATLFSSALAIIVASEFFLYSINIYGKKYFNFILNLFSGVGFLVLSIDETFGLHEYFNTILKETLSSESSIRNAAETSWIFSLLLLIIIALFFLTLLILSESEKNAQLFYILGLICFVIVIVLEPLAFHLPFYTITISIEEGLEMIGLCMFMNGIILKNDTLISRK